MPESRSTTLRKCPQSKANNTAPPSTRNQDPDQSFIELVSEWGAITTRQIGSTTAETDSRTISRPPTSIIIPMASTKRAKPPISQAKTAPSRPSMAGSSPLGLTFAAPKTRKKKLKLPRLTCREWQKPGSWPNMLFKMPYCHSPSSLKHLKPNFHALTMNVSCVCPLNRSTREAAAFWNTPPSFKWSTRRLELQQTLFGYITVSLRDYMTMFERSLDPMWAPTRQLTKWRHEASVPMNSLSAKTPVGLAPVTRTPPRMPHVLGEHKPCM